MVNLLQLLFSINGHEEVVPPQQREHIVKKGDKNYRGLTLLSVVGEIFILNDRLVQHLDEGLEKKESCR